MKRMLALLLVFVLALMCCGCDSTPAEENSADEVQQQEVVTEADPKKALDEIYAQLMDRTTGLMNATYAEVRDVMGFDLETLEEFYIRYMETDYGASDVYILKPVKGQEDTVRQVLKNWQESRVRSFIGYDIYNSTEISQNAVIFQRGDYIVMLMMEDNEVARNILEQYIPEELHLND